MGLALTDQQIAQLLRYLDLLCKWNRAYNLTAVRDPQQMVTRHLLDSLAVADSVSGGRCLDVGTGAGLPGVVLAIVHPDSDMHLLDSNGKKTRFLFQVKTALALDNIVIHRARAETFVADPAYDLVLSRAYASLAAMFDSCRHLVGPGGRLLAMKGAYPAEELQALTHGTVQVRELSVPGLDEARHLVDIQV